MSAMSAMLNVLVATCISMAQLLQLSYLSVFDLDVIGFSSEIY